MYNNKLSYNNKFIMDLTVFYNLIDKYEKYITSSIYSLVSFHLLYLLYTDKNFMNVFMQVTYLILFNVMCNFYLAFNVPYKKMVTASMSIIFTSVVLYEEWFFRSYLPIVLNICNLKLYSSYITSIVYGLHHAPNYYLCGILGREKTLMDKFIFPLQVINCIYFGFIISEVSLSIGILLHMYYNLFSILFVHTLNYMFKKSKNSENKVETVDKNLNDKKFVNTLKRSKSFDNKINYNNYKYITVNKSVYDTYTSMQKLLSEIEDKKFLKAMKETNMIY